MFKNVHVFTFGDILLVIGLAKSFEIQLYNHIIFGRTTGAQTLIRISNGF